MAVAVAFQTISQGVEETAGIASKRIEVWTDKRRLFGPRGFEIQRLLCKSRQSITAFIEVVDLGRNAEAGRYDVSNVLR